MKKVKSKRGIWLYLEGGVGKLLKELLLNGKQEGTTGGWGKAMSTGLLETF